MTAVKSQHTEYLFKAFEGITTTSPLYYWDHTAWSLLSGNPTLNLYATAYHCVLGLCVGLLLLFLNPSLVRWLSQFEMVLGVINVQGRWRLFKVAHQSIKVLLLIPIRHFRGSSTCVIILFSSLVCNSSSWLPLQYSSCLLPWWATAWAVRQGKHECRRCIIHLAGEPLLHWA